MDFLIQLKPTQVFNFFQLKCFLYLWWDFGGFSNLYKNIRNHKNPTQWNMFSGVTSIISFTVKDHFSFSRFLLTCLRTLFFFFNNRFYL